MDINPTVIIAAIGLTLTLLLIFAGIVGGFVRMESKISSLTEDRNEMYRHVENGEIHHKAGDLDRRFTELAHQLTSVKDDVKEGFQKIADRIDRMLEK